MFDKTRPHGYSSLGGIVYQDGKWYRVSDGARVDEEGNATKGTTDDDKGADALAEVLEKATVKDVPENKPPVPDSKPQVPDTTEETSGGYSERLAALKTIGALKLKSMAKDVMASLDADGVDFEVPQMSGKGLAPGLREFIATHTG